MFIHLYYLLMAIRTASELFTQRLIWIVLDYNREERYGSHEHFTRIREKTESRIGWNFVILEFNPLSKAFVRLEGKLTSDDDGF